MTPATTFAVDTLHLTRLLCECYGKPVCELPAGSEVMEHVGGLTAQQARVGWPEQAEMIREHAAVCLGAGVRRSASGPGMPGVGTGSPSRTRPPARRV
jgi:hypothetical protein